MDVKNQIRQMALQQGVLLNAAVPSSEIHNFLARFRQNYAPVDLIRVGGPGDGGYLVPDALETLTHCFSPGVSDTADFEHELSTKYGVTSFMADASVTGPPFDDENFFFIPKFLGNRSAGEFITLSDWVESSLGSTSSDEMILQMDIEGAEYDVLTFESRTTLSQFKIMVIEFHYLDKMFEKQFLRTLTSIFEKIYLDFTICHVHPNNCCGMVSRDGITVPRVAEMTFVRKSLVAELTSSAGVTLPHRLDQKNIDQKPDVVMPEIWWKNI